MNNWRSRLWEIILSVVAVLTLLLVGRGIIRESGHLWPLPTLILLGILLSVAIGKGKSVDNLSLLFVPKAWLIALIVVAVFWLLLKLG